MDDISKHIEVLIFASKTPLKVEEIYNLMYELFDQVMTEEEIRSQIQHIQQKYTDESFPFEIVEAGGGFQFMSKTHYHHTVSILDKHRSKKKLSVAAMECLSIIAYKQPVTKMDVEKIRGVNCDYTIQKLLDKELVSIKGRSDLPGRPLLYATSDKFMEHFGINSIADLPKLKDIEVEKESEIGNREER